MVFSRFHRSKHLCGLLSTRYKLGAMEARVNFPEAGAWVDQGREKHVAEKTPRRRDILGR